MEDTKSRPFLDGLKMDELRRLHSHALEEVIDSIRAKLVDGQKPQRIGRPQISMRDNGMPSITDKPLFGGNGPLEYSSVLEPPWNDDAARLRGKFPEDRFSAVTELKRLVSGDPSISFSYMEKPHEDLLRILVEIGLEQAANTHFLKFGEGPSDEKSRSVVLRPLLVGLTAERLATPVVIPIALTRFSFERARLAEDAILIRMSDGLQRARWEGKVHAANGHDAVLAAATHALVLTGWSVPNSPKLTLAEHLSLPAPEVTAEVESFFAALRLELGIDTGYAQEIRLSKGWRSHDRHGDPEVHAVGARRYPSRFDDFGWMRGDLPLIDRADIEAVAKTWQTLRSINDHRLVLAMRRLNAAMTRDDPADTILDATIALEVLLGDGDGQSIAWKLRMRAAALVGIDADRLKMEDIRTAIKKTYDARSAIVHGKRGRSAQDDGGHSAAQVAVNALRTVIKQLVKHPDHLDPHRIDETLLLTSRVVDVNHASVASADP